MTRDDEIEAEALEWTKRVQHRGFKDWEALSDWLELDQRHSASYLRLASLDAEVAAAARELRGHPLETVRPAPPIQLSKPRSRPPVRLAGPQLGLLAASVVLVVGLGAVGLNFARRPTAGASSAAMIIATRPGERRDLRLADGTQVAVAGATRLVIDAAAHHVELEEGQATFSVVHDPKRQFTVRLGGATVVDVGTIFDLRRRNGRNTLAVVEGEVQVDGASAPVEVVAGRRLRFGGGAAAEFDAISPEVATGWQRGRLNYVDAPMSDVVADIAEITGAEIRLAPQVAGQRFSGALTLRGDPGQALRNVAPAMGLTVARDGEVWVLSSAHDPLQRQ